MSARSPVKPEDPAERRDLARGAAALGVPLDATALDRMQTYLGELRRWNRSYNLVAPGELQRLIPRHVLDALAIHADSGQGPLLDVGAGAGFPGLPLAIVDPSRPVVLIDGAGKKVRFLRHVVRTLGLGAVEAVHGRVESFSPGRDFSTITARALGSLADFAALVRHLATPATRLLAMKGKFPDEELAALPPWVRAESVRALDIPGADGERHLVTLRLAPDSTQ